ncbi:MAG: hypothetical protein QXY05_00815 [Candidatus Anstonellales archaeon]
MGEKVCRTIVLAETILVVMGFLLATGRALTKNMGERKQQTVHLNDEYFKDRKPQEEERRRDKNTGDIPFWLGIGLVGIGAMGGSVGLWAARGKNRHGCGVKDWTNVELILRIQFITGLMGTALASYQIYKTIDPTFIYFK